jgi:hypothetical protein
MSFFSNLSNLSLSNTRSDRDSVKLTDAENAAAQRFVSELCKAREVKCDEIASPITEIETKGINNGMKMPFRTKKNVLGLLVHCMIAVRVAGHKADPVNFPKDKRAWACDKGALLRAAKELNADEKFVNAVFQIEEDENEAVTVG